MGDFSGVVEYEEIGSGMYSNRDHQIKFFHEQDILLVNEEFENPPYGMGVTFEGTYRRG